MSLHKLSGWEPEVKEPWLPEPKYTNIEVGGVTICAGSAYTVTGSYVHGWHLPGMGFTTSWARAAEVAMLTDQAVTRGMSI